MLSVHGYQVCLLGGGKVGDSGGGSASNDECCVNLAVLQGISGVSEVLVYSGDVLFDIDAISTKDVYCVEVNAGVGSANGNGLALQVGNGLDVSVAGNDLNLLGVQSCNNGEVLVCCTVEEVGTVVGIGCNVGLAECELCFVAFKGLDVCLGAFAGKSVYGDASVVGCVLGKNATVSVIRARFAASYEAQFFAALAVAR